MSVTAASYNQSMARMREQWRVATTESNPVPGWYAEIERMRRDQEQLVGQGLWRSGGRTLLRALGVHHDEVIMCRGLAWLLTPDGWHGLGSAVLDALLNHLKLEVRGSSNAVVVTEEARGDTRADIVIRCGALTLVIEAKIWAPEQATQADRLAMRWEEGEGILSLAFLTRDGRLPGTAVDSREVWQPISWQEIAEMIEGAIQNRPDCEPGVREYLRTLQVYGGRTR